MSLISVVCGVFSVSATGALWWVRLRRQPRRETVHNCHCAGCGQKMRYSASRCGRGVICPRCGRRWTLPAEAEGLPTAIRSTFGRQEKIGRRVALNGGR